MKKFEITSKGSLSQYMKTNAIKAKNEIAEVLLMGPGIGDKSCFDITAVTPSNQLSVSL